MYPEAGALLLNHHELGGAADEGRHGACKGRDCETLRVGEGALPFLRQDLGAHCAGDRRSTAAGPWEGGKGGQLERRSGGTGGVLCVRPLTANWTAVMGAMEAALMTTPR